MLCKWVNDEDNGGTKLIEDRLMSKDEVESKDFMNNPGKYRDTPLRTKYIRIKYKGNKYSIGDNVIICARDVKTRKLLRHTARIAMIRDIYEDDCDEPGNITILTSKYLTQDEVWICVYMLFSRIILYINAILCLSWHIFEW